MTGAVQLRDVKPVAAASGNVANAAAVATLPSEAGKMTYIRGFCVTAGGATGGSNVLATVTGLAVAGGTLTFVFSVPAGPTSQIEGEHQMNFDPPLPASAFDVDIVVTLPALGAGNTHAAVNAWGFIE